jgi:phosphocarrier protein HPr
VIAGMNLPMLIKLTSVRKGDDMDAALTEAQAAGRKYINVASQVCPGNERPGRRGPTIIRDLEIVNKRGLHARASARFVQLVGAYQAEVTVSKDGIAVGGTSIMGLMMLAASPGCCIRSKPAVPRPRNWSRNSRMVADRFGEAD